MWCCSRIKKIKWLDRVTNEVLDCVGEKMTLLNYILLRNVNFIGYILRRNCLLRDVIEGQMTKAKVVGRRRTQLHGDLRNIR